MTEERFDVDRISNPQAGGEPVIGEKGRVLIADDDASILTSVSRTLQGAGYSCTTVGDGAAALDALGRGDFDVALLDIEMPELDGLELVHEIRQRDILAVPVILSSYSKVPNVVEAMKLGAFDFLEKPATPESIEGAVARAAAHAAIARRARELAGLAEKWETAYNEVSDQRRLQEAVIWGIEEEQRRIGQELHDGLAQQLSGASYLAEALQNRLEATCPEEAPKTARILELLRQSIVQTRTLARGLCPAGLETTGIIVAIQELLADLEDLYGIPCHFSSEPGKSAAETGLTKVLDKHMKTHLYRIVQEAVNNAIKHSSAKRIDVECIVNEDEVVLNVKDDGVGLPAEPKMNEGMGLRSMRLRAGMIGADFSIQSVPEGGAVISCRLKRKVERAGDRLPQGEMGNAK